MLKGALPELDPDTDCIGRVMAFKYVIPDGLYKTMETGAALLMGAHEYFTLPHLFWPDSGGLRLEFHQNPPESTFSGLIPILAGVSANFGIYSGFSLVSFQSQSGIFHQNYWNIPIWIQTGLFQKFWQPLRLKPN
jgi:hypothetical protein